MPKPRGRPPCFAHWDGESWVPDHDALDKAADKLVANREKCKERKRAIREAIKKAKPQLFDKIPKGQTRLEARTPE